MHMAQKGIEIRFVSFFNVPSHKVPFVSISLAHLSNHVQNFAQNMHETFC